MLGRPELKLGTINAVLSTWHLRWADKWGVWHVPTD
jgi:hypothetical protein